MTDEDEDFAERVLREHREWLQDMRRRLQDLIRSSGSEADRDDEVLISMGIDPR